VNDSTNKEIDMTATKMLVPDADLTHEDSRAWYESYGWHISTENGGDVTHDAVEYDWLDDADSVVIAKLREKHAGLTGDEAESIVEKAREIREAGEGVADWLSEAVAAYLRGDVAGVVEALDAAATMELPHGDTPAANSLRAELLQDAHEYYIYTDDGSYDPFVAADVAEALERTDVPESVRDTESFVAWLERVGGYGAIEEDGEIIAEVKS
jgi:hypothetical protein